MVYKKKGYRKTRRNIPVRIRERIIQITAPDPSIEVIVEIAAEQHNRPNTMNPIDASAKHSVAMNRKRTTFRFCT